MKYFSGLFNGSIWALTIALLCFQNEWLQMRVNTGWIFFALWPLLSILFMWLTYRRKVLLNGKFTLLNLIICLLLSGFILGWPSLETIPAALVREGLHQPRIPFETINRVIIAWLILGSALIGWTSWNKPKHH